MDARWKYVVYLDAEGIEVIEAFEPDIIHADHVARENIARDRLVSAGFATAEGDCFGRSTSLGIKSRPRADTALLKALRG